MKTKNLPESVQTKFNRKLFKIGQFVCMDWLGDEYYGYIKDIKQTNHGYTYKVATKKYTYPVGVKINQYRSIQTGYILYDRTKELGDAEVERRYRESLKHRDIVYRSSTRNDSDSDTDIGTTNETVLSDKPTTRVRRKNANKSNNTASNEKPTTSRKSSSTKSTTADKSVVKSVTRKSYSKLDEAIEKQKEFLRKFT